MRSSEVGDCVVYQPRGSQILIGTVKKVFSDCVRVEWAHPEDKAGQKAHPKVEKLRHPDIDELDIWRRLTEQPGAEPVK